MSVFFCFHIMLQSFVLHFCNAHISAPIIIFLLKILLQGIPTLYEVTVVLTVLIIYFVSLWHIQMLLEQDAFLKINYFNTMHPLIEPTIQLFETSNVFLFLKCLRIWSNSTPPCQVYLL